MSRRRSILENEDGSALIVAILVLILLTLIGIAATTTTNIEIQIAGNDKSHKVAFHNADGGIYTVPKIISQAINEKATPNLGTGITYLDPINDDGPNPTFYRELTGFDPHDDAPDIQFPLDGSYNVNVDVERVKAVTLYGGGAEFASAAGGAGVSAKGILFDLDSFGSGPDNSQSNIGARYLKVIDVAGGM